MFTILQSIAVKPQNDADDDDDDVDDADDDDDDGDNDDDDDGDDGGGGGDDDEEDDDDNYNDDDNDDDNHDADDDEADDDDAYDGNDDRDNDGDDNDDDDNDGDDDDGDDNGLDGYDDDGNDDMVMRLMSMTTTTMIKVMMMVTKKAITMTIGNGTRYLQRKWPQCRQVDKNTPSMHVHRTWAFRRIEPRVCSLWEPRKLYTKLYTTSTKWPNTWILNTSPSLSLPSSKSTFSQPFKDKCINDLGRIGSIIIFHLSKLWKAKFSILCDVIFLVRLQGKFESDHSWEWKD